MTNREKYAKEILDVACSGGSIALVKRKIVDCNDVEDCGNCHFQSSKNGVKKCAESVKIWANKEYTEPKIQPGVKDLKVDDKVLVSNDNHTWRKRHFCRYDSEEDYVYTFECGATSWTTNLTTSWVYAKLPDE